MPPSDSTRPALASRAILLPVAVLAVASALVVSTWNLLRVGDRAAAARETVQAAEQAARRLESYVEARLLVLEVVRREVLSGSAGDRESFGVRTRHLQAEFGGFHAINWIDPAGKIRWVSPERANRSAIGRNVFEHSQAGGSARRARDTLRPTMTPPVQLFQGGHAFTIYYPVLDDGELRGFVNGVFLIEPLVHESIGDVRDRFEVLIEDADVLVHGTPDAFRDAALESVAGESGLTVLGRRWRVRLAPKPTTWAAMVRGDHLPFLLGGLVLAVLAAFGVRVQVDRVEHRRREVEERRQFEGRLRQAQKMEALGQLAGGVAHDFNNLLIVMMGNTDVLLGREDLSDQARTNLEQVMSACERAAQLTSQLLTFSRKQVVQTRPLDLAAELSRLEPMLHRLARDDIELSLDFDARAGVVEIDPGQISQVVMNLFVNAMDAMPDGGVLRVSLRRAESSPEEVSGPWAVLAVEDSGVGMSDATRARALDPFFTTKPVGEGTGIGLSIVYGIVTQAGGDVHISGAEGEGTSVEVWLPIASREADESNNDGTASPRSLEGSVLVVEDDPEVRSLAAAVLESAGLDVVVARDGAHALKLVELGVAFDIVVTDAVMPGLGGADLIARLRERGMRFRALICSGYAARLSGDDLERIDARFLAKPYPPGTLIDAVAELLEATGCEPGHGPGASSV